jgi:hypothetical protein
MERALENARQETPKPDQKPGEVSLYLSLSVEGKNKLNIGTYVKPETAAKLVNDINELMNAARASS